MTLQDTFQKFIECYSKYTKPFKFNILSEQQGHIVENSHTNILMKLLEYKENDNYPFCESFCKNVFSTWNTPVSGDVKFDNEHFTKTESTNGKIKNGRIDGFISKENDFAIIIENKINGAGDQPEQILRYVDNTRNSGFKEDKIWIIYLTSVGGEPNKKECEAFFYTLGWRPLDAEEPFEHEHYAPISYRDNILPWLKEEVLPNIKMKDLHLFTGVLQYVDFLEDMYSSNDLPEELINETEDLLGKYLQEHKADSYSERVKALHEFYTNEFKESKTNEEVNAFLSIVEKYNQKPTLPFAKVTKDYFNRVYGCECHVHSHFCNYYINIYNKNWGKHVFFGWSPNSLSKIEKGESLTFTFHCDNEAMRNELNDYLIEQGYKKADRVPTDYRKEVYLGMKMSEIKENDLKNIYKELVQTSFINLIDKTYNKYYPQ